MSGIIDNCSHKYEITDCRGEGIVCGDCGLVLDICYEKQLSPKEFYNISIENKNFVLDIIDRLNVPSYISSYIFKKLEKVDNGNFLKEVSIAKCVYSTLSELGIPFSAKDICAVSGIKTCKIASADNKLEESRSVVIINKEDILERTCSKLNLNFQDYTLIKESLLKNNNGFNPSTVISANIYIFCKANKIKITLKKISDVTGISCMSIQRYIKKNAFSSGSKSAKR